jgi:uncharacterized repeat protein (TIGR03803 family)
MKLTHSLLLSALALAAGLSLARGAGVEAPSGELLRASDGSFYGTSAHGGTAEYGTIFRVTPESEVTVLLNFTGTLDPAKGAYPHAGLVADAAGLLWGTTSQGGVNGLGTIFKFSPTTGAFTTVVEFNGTNGSTPEAGLVDDGAGHFWGTTSEGGAASAGTVFQIDALTGALTTKVDFTGTGGAAKGSAPKAAVLLYSSFVWGVTSTGGVGNLGTIFKLDPTNNTFTTVVEFTGTNDNAKGAAPVAALIKGNHRFLWGTTSSGGATDHGTVFAFDPWANEFDTVIDFDGANGSYPKAPIFSDGSSDRLYGLTSRGGTDDLGTIFEIQEDPLSPVVVPTPQIILHLVQTGVVQFTGTSGAAKGAYPLAGLSDDGLGGLWGTTSQGGRDDRGTIFKLLIATDEVKLIAEPSLIPTPPIATVKLVAGSLLIGPVGAPVTLNGTAKDNVELFSVIVSINGGPFVPATITPSVIAGKPATWQLDVIPENGVNVVVIKSVDNSGDTSKPVKLIFNYTVIRTEVAGSYNGLATPMAASLTPFLHTGVFRLKVTASGRFTGTLTLGGVPLPVVLTGSFGNAGAARFGKTGATVLVIPRKNLPSLHLTLNLDVDAPFSRQITGTLREAGVDVAALLGGQALYTAKKNPLPPLLNVPTTLLDPATDRGAYTGYFRAHSTLPTTDFPQGDGYALVKITPAGLVQLTGRLADGTPFAAGNALSPDNTLPFYVRLYAGAGALSGPISFREITSQSDADGIGMLWFRPPIAKAPAYRAGWPGGITADFFGSKFVTPAISGKTLLGNAPGAANALIEFSAGGLASTLSNLLSLSTTGSPTVLAAPAGGTAAPALKVTALATGLLNGSFVHPGSLLSTPFTSVVFQKTQIGAGYFIAAPPQGAPTTDPKQSGRVDLSAQ